MTRKLTEDIYTEAARSRVRGEKRKRLSRKVVHNVRGQGHQIDSVPGVPAKSCLSWDHAWKDSLASAKDRKREAGSARLAAKETWIGFKVELVVNRALNISLSASEKG